MGAEHDELMSAIRSMDDKLNKRMDNIEKIIAEFKNVKEDVVKLKKKQEDQSQELNTITEGLHTIKQNLLDSDFIITGVPESEEISTIDTVNNILKNIKIKISENDVKSCYRMRNKNNKSCPPICVELYSKTLRAAIFIQQKKQGPVLLSSIDKSVSDADTRKIYIQNRLTPFHLELMRDARKFKMDNNYKFVWFQNTDVLLKKSDSSRIIRIRSKADLLSLESQSN